MACGGFLPRAGLPADGLQDSYCVALIANILCVGYFCVNNSGVTVTKYNKRKPVRTRREGVKERLYALYNVLVSWVENHLFVAKELACAGVRACLQKIILYMSP